MESAVSRTLHLSELLHAVLLQLRLSWIADEDRTILHCPLVNRLWESECNRILWEYCRVSYDNHHPAVTDLVALPKNRRQKYANYIRRLWIGPQYSFEPSKWEGRYHTELLDLSFPKLEELQLDCPSPDDREEYEIITTLSQYLQPHLTEITMFGIRSSSPVDISNDILSTISSRSNRLKALHLHLPSESITASKQSLISFFSSMVFLKSVTLGHGALEQISAEVFLALSHMPSLEKLRIHSIRDEWTGNLESGSFGALRSLECQLSSMALEQLLRIQDNFDELRLEATGNSTDMLSVVAQLQLRSLKSLCIEPCAGTEIMIDDLLNIAESNDQLLELEIPQQWDDDVDLASIARGINDTTLMELAKRLPKLESLSLLYEGSELSARSLISLGENCSSLRKCWLSAIVTYKDLIRDAKPGTFPNLRELTILEPDEDGAEDVIGIEVESTARAMLELMPKLDYPDFPAHVDLYLALRNVMRERTAEAK